VPKWSKDAKEFEVKVYYNVKKGSQIRVPKPVLDKFSNPTKIKFVVDGKSVKILPVKSTLEQAKESLKRKRGRNASYR